VNDAKGDCTAAAGHAGISRRRLLGGLASLGATAWLPLFRAGPASAEATRPPPPAFPPAIELYQQAYENWAGDIRLDALWTCAPKTPADVVEVVNWARVQGYTVRPRGSMHGWSPLTVLPDAPAAARVLLLDTTQHLTAIAMVSPLPQAAVRAQAGALLENVLRVLEAAGCGLAASPAPGDVTIGGALAVDAHGTGVPARGEQRQPGHSFGSLSNLIVSLTAVVWDEALGAYALREYPRAHPHCKALLTHVGRAFVTEVTLRAGPDYQLRCISHLDIPAAELFAAPGTGGRSIASFVEQTGRMEVIWFPFTRCPWLKVWSLAPEQPAGSRAVTEPYNYAFADNVPREVSDLADLVVSGQGALTPLFTQTEFAAVTAGMEAMQAADLWGPSKNLLLYVKPTTLRVTANGYAILTRRDNIQQVCAEFFARYQAMLQAYRLRGQYPINGPVEIRVTGLDHAHEPGIEQAESPVLSALRPLQTRPDWDVAIWLDLLTFPGTPDADSFFREFEDWAFRHYSGSYALLRPEWSKGWAYGAGGAWTDATVIGQRIPEAFRAGTAQGWEWAQARLRQTDPYRIYSNAFLDRLMPG